MLRMQQCSWPPPREPQPIFNDEESELAELFEDTETQAVVDSKPVEETTQKARNLEDQNFGL